MSAAGKPPYRADHVGSLLRPPGLKQAREDAQAGRIGAAQLKEAEDRATREAVAIQEAAGLSAITDGEKRRRSTSRSRTCACRRSAVSPARWSATR
jgi:5-methyltetrahydropteroyltriglutamate--homocysteine methyltransferase